MELTIIVYNSVCQVTPRLAPTLAVELDELLAFGLEGAQFTQQFINNQWDGKKHLFNARNQAFPTGYLMEAVSFFKERGIVPVIDDRRNIPELSEHPVILQGRDPWKHQLKVFQTISGMSRGLIQVATGGGKTFCIAGTYAFVNQPGIVLTYRKELMFQLRNELQNFLGEKVGIFGDGQWEEGRLTVCMAQSLLKATEVKYSKLLKEFDEPDTAEEKEYTGRKIDIWEKLIKATRFVAIDECHHVGAQSSYQLIQNMENAYWRYGFSATAHGFREDKKDFFVKAAIGDVIELVSTSDLVDEGILVPTDIIMVDFSHAGHRYPKDTYNEYYYKAVVENDERNKILIQTAYHLYKAGKPVLMAVQRVDHGKTLELAMQHLCGVDNAKFVYGNDHSTYRDKTLKDFADQKLPILISTLISEGINIPHLTYTIAGRGEESRIATIQLMGRGMRAFPGKTKAVYVDIMDRKTAWLGKHTKTREIAYNNERAFTTIPVDVKDLGNFLKTYQL
jgi:superfamily II DNA or RNA helicase